MFLERDLTGKYLSKDIERSQPSTKRQGRAYNGSIRSLAKSVSVPAILEEGIGFIGFLYLQCFIFTVSRSHKFILSFGKLSIFIRLLTSL